MDRGTRYQPLTNEEESEVTMEMSRPLTVALVVPPPSPAETQPGTPEESDHEEDRLDASAQPAPPPYSEVAAKLPTYEEATKITDSNGQVTETLSSDDESVSGTARDMTVGNDSIFFLSFVFAFLFNWIGFLMAYCLSSSAAGRLGALSGFGLSLVKWILIFKHSQCCTDIVDSQTWLWWILIVLGVMICLQGLFNYVRVRRQAIQGNNRHYLFFYY
ncbi:NEDD4 family-interacting protein 1-like [Branchiostoma lanceolatum]